MQAGFTDYLTKPIQEKELNDVLLKYLPQEKLSLHIEGDEEETEVTDTAGIPAADSKQKLAEISGQYRHRRNDWQS